jgi:hypothetical protein
MGDSGELLKGEIAIQILLDMQQDAKDALLVVLQRARPHPCTSTRSLHHLPPTGLTYLADFARQLTSIVEWPSLEQASNGKSVESERRCNS